MVLAHTLLSTVTGVCLPLNRSNRRPHEIRFIELAPSPRPWQVVHSDAELIILCPTMAKIAKNIHFDRSLSVQCERISPAVRCWRMATHCGRTNTVQWHGSYYLNPLFELLADHHVFPPVNLHEEDAPLICHPSFLRKNGQILICCFLGQ